MAIDECAKNLKPKKTCQTLVKKPRRLSPIGDWTAYSFISDRRVPQPVPSKEKIMMPVESRLQDEMRSCAVELRQLAYTLQNGVGEHDLLRLSERMRAAADQVVRSGA